MIGEPLQLLFRELDDLVKPRRIVDRDLRQRLPIQLRQSLLQAVDELAVAQPARPAGGVDADDPQPAELPLLRTPVAEGEGPRLDSASSLPSGFYDYTAGQIQAQTQQNNYTAQQTKPVAKDANAGGLNHVDILSYMLGRPVATAG